MYPDRDIVSDVESPDVEAEEPEFDIGPPLFAEDETGDGIDDSRLRLNAEPPPPARDAKPGIPTIGEWEDFFSRILLRVAGDWYIQYAFSGIDENALTEREIQRIQMTDDERKRISVPFAELSHKSKVMRRYGRTIIASGGAFDAIVAIGIWTSRVNRIARKYRPIQGRVVGERSRQGTPTEANGGVAGSNGGRVGEGWTIVNPGG
jgi:hypothetical protein